MPKIGDERFLVETIDVRDVEAMARKDGWPGGTEGLREFCEPQDAAKYRPCATLDEATDMARFFLATGQAFYGSVLIDRQRFEREYPDVPAEWNRQQTFEVAMDGERIEVEA